jgi:hypothetical protein
MDQRSICLFLDRQGLSASVIHEQLVAVLGPDAIVDSIITSNLRRLLWTPDTEARPISGGPDIVDQAIRTAVDEQPFSSVRSIAKRM